MKKSILLIAVLMVLPAACCVVLNGKNREPVQSLPPDAVADTASASDQTEMTSPAIDMNHLLGHIDPATDNRFSRVEKPYAHRAGMYLLDDVYDAFVRMHRAARKDGVSLVVVSATRNFNAQKRIWERKWTGAQRVDGRNLAKAVPNPIERARIILKYSSMPGTSRHHWGTDIDINSVNNAYFKSPTGRKVYRWLAAHAKDFGFCQTYTAKGNDRPHGYEEEPWHWSYCPLAESYLQQYAQTVTYDDIRGFKGADTAARLDVIKHYVLAINPQCLKH
jgi:LAS superfamily LD-carboxypeptidase LdcB